MTAFAKVCLSEVFDLLRVVCPRPRCLSGFTRGDVAASHAVPGSSSFGDTGVDNFVGARPRTLEGTKKRDVRFRLI